MKECIRATGIANRVRMKRSVYPSHAFVLVEGEDDEAVFRRHTDRSKCRIQVAHGKPNVVAAVEELNRACVQGILGIVDSDFCALDGGCGYPTNVVLTDLHDIECMMLASPALGHVLDEVGEEEKILGFEKKHECCVATHLLRLAAAIGIVRWASARNGWKLRFDNLDFGGFVDNDLQFDVEEFYAALRAHQGGRCSSPPPVETIRAGADSLTKQNPDPWHVSCGHDAVYLLSIGLRRALASRRDAEVSVNRLESLLRASYESSYFKASLLRDRILAWETENAPFSVL